MSKFQRNGRDNIEEEPGFGVSKCNQFRLVDEKISTFVKVGNKECENNVNSKKAVDNIICYDQRTPRLIKEPKFKGANPCSIEN